MPAKFFVPFVLAVLLSATTEASDIVDVSPVSSSVLLIEFDDGWVELAGPHQSRSKGTIHSSPLDVTKADNASSYTIRSEDDADYSNGLKPSQVHRKSKPQDALPTSSEYPYVLNHYIYLVLPQPLKQGKSYALSLGGLAENKEQWPFILNYRTIRSEAIKVNQLGYQPNSQAKYGYVCQWMGTGGGLDLSSYSGKPFHILDANTRKTVHTGTIALRMEKETRDLFHGSDAVIAPWQNYNNADVYECDFSAFSTPGEYVLAIEGMGHSFPFMIHSDVYRMAYYHAIRGLWHQRACYAKKQPYTRWEMEADWHGTEGSNRWGWYHDAADWDGYGRHINVPAQLLLAYQANAAAFTDGDMNIPESGNGIPDVLDEASWLLNWYRRTRAVYGGLTSDGRIDGDGQKMVVDGKSFNPEGMNYSSAEDTRVFELEGSCTKQTGIYGGLCGWLSALLDALPNHPAHVDDSVAKWRTEAVECFELASGDKEYAAAAAGAFRATGDTKYETALKNTGWIKNNYYLWDGWAGATRSLAYWIYAFMKDGVSDTELHQYAKNAIESTAKRWYMDPADQRSYRNGFGKECPLGYGMGSTPWTDNLIAAWGLTGDPKYLSYIQTTADHSLGNNPLNQVYLTGLGDRPVTGALLCDQLALGWRNPFPGILPFGPTTIEWNYYPVYSTFKTLEEYYPQPYQSTWPFGERWGNQRWAIGSNEWTVNQTVSPAAATFAALLSKDNPLPVNKEPSITITAPSGATGSNQYVVITVDTKDEDGYISHVDFFNDGRFIGRATQAPFTLFWEAPAAGTYTLEAMTFDNVGDHWYSEPVSVTVGSAVADDTPPGAPTGVIVSQTSELSGTVAWAPPADADVVGYEVYVDGQLQTFMPVGKTSCALRGLDDFGQRAVQVRSVDRNGNRSELSAQGSLSATMPSRNGAAYAGRYKRMLLRVGDHGSSLVQVPAGATGLRALDMQGRLVGSWTELNSAVVRLSSLNDRVASGTLLILRFH